MQLRPVVCPAVRATTQPVLEIDGIDGADGSGTIYCVVDSGGRVLRIGVNPDWWPTLGPAGVAGAVLDAVRFAKSKAAMARLILDRHGHQVDLMPSGRSLGLVSELPEPLPSSDSPNYLKALQRELDRISLYLDEVERLQRERDSGVPRVFDGPNGLFQLVLTGPGNLRAEVNEYGMHRRRSFYPLSSNFDDADRSRSAGAVAAVVSRRFDRCLSGDDSADVSMGKRRSRNSYLRKGEMARTPRDRLVRRRFWPHAESYWSLEECVGPRDGDTHFPYLTAAYRYQFVG
ncbi:hypothetical protein [Plantactinospora sp. WMMB782]|uniref:hypothetical protein n=1 Tax=Plantactinospora sp. WMMB782 TaxID=3404121 RepID=UPI003B93A496